jgi:hypothetical protein
VVTPASANLLRTAALKFLPCRQTAALHSRTLDGWLEEDGPFGLFGGGIEGVWPIEGSQQVVFATGEDVGAVGWVEQTFATHTNEDYEVRFRMGVIGATVGLDWIRVTARDESGTILAEVFDGSNTGFGLPVGYKPEKRLVFTAKTPTTKLRFEDASFIRPANYSRTLLDGVKFGLAPLRPTIEVSQVRIAWEALTSHVYQVQYQSALTSNLWLNLGDPIPGSSGTNHIFDSADAPQKFYQVIRLQ